MFVRPSRSLIKAYGASKAGDKIQRSTVLVDKEGKVTAVWNPVREETAGRNSQAPCLILCTSPFSPVSPHGETQRARLRKPSLTS